MPLTVEGQRIANNGVSDEARLYRAIPPGGLSPDEIEALGFPKIAIGICLKNNWCVRGGPNWLFRHRDNIIDRVGELLTAYPNGNMNPGEREALIARGYLVE